MASIVGIEGKHGDKPGAEMDDVWMSGWIGRCLNLRQMAIVVLPIVVTTTIILNAWS
jgi:hypothetical protein